MDAEQIRREVIRLSPWYYRFDLGEVSTDITPACDHHGHRTVSVPGPSSGTVPPAVPTAAPYLEDKTVLDLGCNEGGFAFSALDNGARHVEGVDCRAINIEKARFVARVLGHDRTSFHVATCDDWLQANRKRYDYVFLFGLLYHLPEPWRTIRECCALAREGVVVGCVLHGGDDGYTSVPEAECIGASADPGQASMMPNTTNTLIAEFAKHGFVPSFVREHRILAPEFWGGCNLILEKRSRWAHWQPVASDAPPEPFDVYILPRDAAEPAERSNPLDVEVVVYNRAPEARDVDVRVATRDARGEVVSEHEPHRLELPARVAPGDPWFSCSSSFRAALELPKASGKTVIEVTLEDPVTSLALGTRALVAGPGHLANVEGWLEADDPFFSEIDTGVDARSCHQPRVFGKD